ncbi:Fc.00g000900.m01.CDS01 [Cosmosporella sp. VM-42]
MNCRTRRIKCDEEKPVCGCCRRKGTECKQPDFIVHDKLSTAPNATEPNQDEGEMDQERTSSSAIHDPESTYDVFRQAQSTTFPAPRGEPQTFDLPDIVITEQAVDLLRIFQNGIGPWMEVFDHSFSFSWQAVRLALSSELLLNSICALAAKQMSLINERSFWEPVAARYYGESLVLLIQSLNQAETPHDVVLTATVILCSYELLANPGPDYRKHMSGATTLIQTRGILVEGTDLERANFWCYARQDVAVSVTHEFPTQIPPHQWIAALRNDKTKDEVAACHILWLLARVLELRFAPMQDSLPDARIEGLRGVSAEMDQWWDGLPATSRGVTTGKPSDDGLTKLWFCVPSAAAGMLYFNMAKILFLEAMIETSSGFESGAGESPDRPVDIEEEYEKLRCHARSISSICFSPGLPDSVIVIAVNPLFYAARYAPSLSLKARIWAFLDDIEVRLGFYTTDRVKQLQTEFEAGIGGVRSKRMDHEGSCSIHA